MRILMALLALTFFVGTALAATGPITAWGDDNGTWPWSGGASTRSGYVYDPDGGIIGGTWDMGTTTGTPDFTVKADIEMWMNMSFAATDIYFHIGSSTDGLPISNTVSGWLESNNGMYLFITKTGEQPTEPQMSQLLFKIDTLGRTAPEYGGDPIPVKWWIKDSGIERQMTYSASGNGGLLRGFESLLDNGTRGYHTFSIRCEITPQEYQPDGHYEMDPVLAASPVL